MSVHLRVVPELRQHQAHAATLTPEHRGRMVTLAGDDGTRIRGILTWATPSLTPGFTVLRLEAAGTRVSLAVPDLAPVHVHPEGPRP